MKKALLITYFFPPLNAVAGLRAWSWAESFRENNIYPTVITRHWSGSETRWADLTSDTASDVVFEAHDNYNIYRIASAKIKALSLLQDNLLKIPFFSKMFYMLINSFGYFNVEADARASFKGFLDDHLKEHKYDFIIVTSPPLNLIRLASELHTRFRIPVHIDFRDLWNNGYLKADYRPPLNLRYIDYFKRSFIKQWLKNARSISAVSGPIAGTLAGMFPGPVIESTNGFDEKKYNNKVKQPSSQFRFSLVGSYYPQQEFDILIEGLKSFLVDKLPSDFVINLVGLSVHETVIARLLNSLPEEFISKKDRVTSDEAAEIIINSEVLFLSAWQGYRGIYTTKLFDYLASGNNILVAPGDDDVMDRLVESGRAGKIANSAGEFTSIMNEWFNEWKSGGVSYGGRPEIIQKYSRHSIASALAEELNRIY